MSLGAIGLRVPGAVVGTGKLRALSPKIAEWDFVVF